MSHTARHRSLVAHLFWGRIASFGVVTTLVVIQMLEYAQIPTLRARCGIARYLSLTYNDGPGEELTPALLALLAAAHAGATFFPTGRSAARNRELLAQIATTGQEVGCHFLNHVHAW